MRVTAEMKIEEALAINEQMIAAFEWLAPEFERLRDSAVRRFVGGRVSVEQAAHYARIPVSEALYVLNLIAGAEEKQLAREMEPLLSDTFEFPADKPPQKPRELLGLRDDDPHVHFVDITPQTEKEEDPQPLILHELQELHEADDVLLVHHPYNRIPLCDLLAGSDYATWAEERDPFDWYIYFYHPAARAGAVVPPRTKAAKSMRAMARGA